jgi:uncharacterized protein YjbJ (UPF0337 family)
MAFDDKVDNKSEEVGGKVKEGVGKATDDEQLEAEGKADQTSSNLKQAGEKIKDAFKSGPHHLGAPRPRPRLLHVQTLFPYGDSGPTTAAAGQAVGKSRSLMAVSLSGSAK